MKFILTSLLLASFNLYASKTTLRVTESYCGEINPLAIGDACIVQASSEKRNYALIVDIDEYQLTELNSIEKNDLITIDDSYLERTQDQSVINEVNNIFDIYYTKYFYYELLFPSISVLKVEKAQVSETLKLICENSSFDDGSYMYAKVKLEATLSLITGGTYELSNINFSYILSMEEDFSYTWAEANVNKPEYISTNLRTYNPQVYKDYIKFNDLYYQEIFGEVDFIIPKRIKKEFTSYMIMTAMDDHWGGTVNLTCTTSY